MLEDLQEHISDCTQAVMELLPITMQILIGLLIQKNNLISFIKSAD